ncbi:Rad28 protein [Saccharomycopsis crataegensis]|uniref:Rad28 protein n=1 Tax=Saccharomycopsis crataegensis TaxID=43959 RepID=A0AAV5QMA6_9ASCO|nr:Rad28 protein [Saccharomycopsis crataegensis]
MTHHDFLLQRRLDPSISIRPTQTVSLDKSSIFSNLISYNELNENLNINKLKILRESMINSSNRQDKLDSLNDLNNDLLILHHHMKYHYRVFPNQTPNSSIVNSMDLDGIEKEYMISGSNNGGIKIWNINETSDNSDGNGNEVLEIGEISSQFNEETNRHRGNISGHGFGISQVKWWPFDTGMFVSSSYDKSIKIWDSMELKLLYSFDNTKMTPSTLYSTIDTSKSGQVYSIDFSQTLKHGLLAIASQGESYIKLLDLKTMTLASYLFDKKLQDHSSNITIKWNPIYDNILATGNNVGELKVWDIRKSDSCIYRLSNDMTKISWRGAGHSKAVNGLCWTNDGSSIVSVGLDNKMKHWKLHENRVDDLVKVNNSEKDGKLAQKKKRRRTNIEQFSLKNHYLRSMDPIINKQHVIYPASEKLLVFDLNDGKLMKTLQKNIQSPQDINFRYTCIVRNEEAYYCGTDRGTIETWGPKYDVLNELDDELEEEDTIKDRRKDIYLRKNQ